MRFEKKTIYHSALVKAGTIDATITSEPTKSKFPNRDGGEQYFIDFTIDGSQHQYIIENDDIRRNLEGWKSRTVQLTATGTKDDAELSIYEDENAPQQDPRQRQREEPPRREEAPQGRGRQSEPPAQQRQSSPPSQRQTSPPRDQDPIKDSRQQAMKIANGYLIAYGAAMHIDKEIVAKYGPLKEDSGNGMTDEHFRACVSTVFIAMDRAGVINTLPAHPLNEDK